MMNVADDATKARRTVLVSELTDGILDPAKPMLGPLIDGGTIVGNTAPGCWGPMITPRIRGGHEVTRPVFVDGAEPGDSVVIRIRNVNVTSFATASGHDRWVEGHFLGDPYAAPTLSELRNKLPGDLRCGYRPTGDPLRHLQHPGEPVSNR
jgi:formamidase